MADRFPDYDVLAKRDTPSWNEQTRAVIDERLALEPPKEGLTPTQFATLSKVVARLCPEPPGRRPTTTPAMVAQRIVTDCREGYRHHLLPPAAECWRRGLDALAAETQERFELDFSELSDTDADALLRAVSRGEVRAGEWRALPPKLFWSWRLLPDCISAHWAQPSLWSAMGFGGPASPRGYVRTGIDRRDPWEAIEAGEPLRGLPKHRA